MSLYYSPSCPHPTHLPVLESTPPHARCSPKQRGGDGSLFLDPAHAKLRPLGCLSLLTVTMRPVNSCCPTAGLQGVQYALPVEFLQLRAKALRGHKSKQPCVASEATLSSPPGDPLLRAPPKTLTRPVVGWGGGGGGLQGAGNPISFYSLEKLKETC